MKHLRNKVDGLLNFSDYKNIGSKIFYGVIIFLLVMFALTAIIPILWLLITSFKLSIIFSLLVFIYTEKLEELCKDEYKRILDKEQRMKFEARNK